jgi:hypothetical protein
MSILGRSVPAWCVIWLGEQILLSGDAFSTLPRDTKALSAAPLP